MSSNILAIVGRPNTGKSTLFNRLIGGRQAIVDPTSGVTRDRNYGHSDWNGISFSVIDTGGYVEGSDDIFEEEIRKQALLAIEEADVILFLTDGREGLTPLDQGVADLLRKTTKPVFVGVNKIDDPSLTNLTAEFYALGLENVYPVSGITGSGTGDLLDAIVKHFKPIREEEDSDDLPRIAVVGRPNVGKSSLINVLTGQERNIVTPIPGTTRDAIDTRYKAFGFDFYLVDTAGLRRKGKVSENIEFYSVMRSIRAIENSDVCILMVDASIGFENQDLNIFSLIKKNHKGVVIAMNKWDLVEKDHKTLKQYEEYIKSQIAPFTDVPIVFTSVTEKQRLLKVLEWAVKVYHNRKNRISTSKLNDTLLPIIEQNPPPMVKGKRVKVKYITQLKTFYPAFVFFCNHPQYVREDYKRFVENQLREHFEFTGAPMEIYFREK
ncbi:MAG: ribosome biogenesis GTPase Der [Bacteroidales bacterium]|jgi:GTP-binding protein|nr:ribosome biogenesis GTPase Der [Bacteroidales bacterium]NPV36597.1 ribosome biogenesis GTPase Der [Bacteroidales bacterium]